MRTTENDQETLITFLPETPEGDRPEVPVTLVEAIKVNTTHLACLIPPFVRTLERAGLHSHAGAWERWKPSPRLEYSCRPHALPPLDPTLERGNDGNHPHAWRGLKPNGTKTHAKEASKNNLDTLALR